MATVQSLRTGQRFVLPIPRREGRENEDDELVEVTMETLQSMRQRGMLAQRPGDRVNDPDFVTALEGGPGSVKGASSLPVVVVNSDHESAEKSFSSLEGRKPDISYPWEFHPNEVAKSRKVLLDRHVTTRSTSLYGVYAPRYNTSIKAETDRTNHHEMFMHSYDIAELLAILGSNGFLRHLLLENKMIGPAGAAALSQWALNNPGNIETWFLAGNFIDATGLERLVGAWIFADNITNIWLRRNLLGPESAYMLSILIKNSPKLRTLDLEQTNLGDRGVADLFGALLPLQTRNMLEIRTPVPPPNGNSETTYGWTSLSPIWIKERACGERVPFWTIHPRTTINIDELTYKSTIALRNIYLNAVGAGVVACWSVGLYLAHSLCPIESLYLSNNPIGNAGAIALANGLASNHSLLRLHLGSCDLTNEGIIVIFRALKAHPRLRSLSTKYCYLTSELGSEYNYFDDGVKGVLEAFILSGPQTLRYLDFGDTAMSVPAIESLAADVTRSDSLVVFHAESVYGSGDEKVLGRMKRKLDENRQRIYGVDDATFSETERRWLMDPKDADIVDGMLDSTLD